MRDTLSRMPLSKRQPEPSNISEQTSAEGERLTQKFVQVDPQTVRRIDKTLFGSSKLSDGGRELGECGRRDWAVIDSARKAL
jgi:hypothetical protein